MFGIAHSTRIHAGFVKLEVRGSSFRTFWSGIQTMCPVAELHQHATGYSTSFTEDLSLLNQVKYSTSHVRRCNVTPLWHFLNISYFWSNSILFGHVQQVNIRHCQFLVNFKLMRFVGFGHIQPRLSVIFIGSC